MPGLRDILEAATPPQRYSVGCHECGDRHTGEAPNRRAALSAVEEWKSTHRLGNCRVFWSAIGPIRLAAIGKPEGRNDGKETK